MAYVYKVMYVSKLNFYFLSERIFMIHIYAVWKREEDDDLLISFKLKPLDYSHAILKAFQKIFFEKGWPNLFLFEKL